MRHFISHVSLIALLSTSSVHARIATNYASLKDDMRDAYANYLTKAGEMQKLKEISPVYIDPLPIFKNVIDDIDFYHVSLDSMIEHFKIPDHAQKYIQDYPGLGLEGIGLQLMKDLFGDDFGLLMHHMPQLSGPDMAAVGAFMNGLSPDQKLAHDALATQIKHLETLMRNAFEAANPAQAPVPAPVPVEFVAPAVPAAEAARPAQEAVEPAAVEVAPAANPVQFVAPAVAPIPPQVPVAAPAADPVGAAVARLAQIREDQRRIAEAALRPGGAEVPQNGNNPHGARGGLAHPALELAQEEAEPLWNEGVNRLFRTIETMGNGMAAGAAGQLRQRLTAMQGYYEHEYFTHPLSPLLLAYAAHQEDNNIIEQLDSLKACMDRFLEHRDDLPRHDGNFQAHYNDVKNLMDFRNHIYLNGAVDVLSIPKTIQKDGQDRNIDWQNHQVRLLDAFIATYRDLLKDTVIGLFGDPLGEDNPEAIRLAKDAVLHQKDIFYFAMQALDGHLDPAHALYASLHDAFGFDDGLEPAIIDGEFEVAKAALFPNENKMMLDDDGMVEKNPFTQINHLINGYNAANHPEAGLPMINRWKKLIIKLNAHRGAVGLNEVLDSIAIASEHCHQRRLDALGLAVEFLLGQAHIDEDRLNGQDGLPPQLRRSFQEARRLALKVDFLKELYPFAIPNPPARPGDLNDANNVLPTQKQNLSHIYGFWAKVFELQGDIYVPGVLIDDADESMGVALALPNSHQNITHPHHGQIPSRGDALNNHMNLPDYIQHITNNNQINLMNVFVDTYKGFVENRMLDAIREFARTNPDGFEAFVQNQFNARPHLRALHPVLFKERMERVDGAQLWQYSDAFLKAIMD